MTFKINRAWVHARDEGPGRRGLAFGAGLALLAVGAAGVRLLALPGLLPDLDAVNFARALVRFDLQAQAPHFPGYPVYVALARGAARLGAPEVLALALPGLVLSVAAVVAVGLALRRLVGEVGALAAALLLALLPLPALAGATPGSDGAGFGALALATAATLALRPGDGGLRAGLAGGLAGVALGVRPSVLVAALALLAVVPRGGRRGWSGGLALGVGAWLLPLVALVGPPALWRIGTGFLRGHAGEWGGTVVVRPDLGERARLFGFDVLAAGLGLPWEGAWSAARVGLGLLVLLTLALLGAVALGPGLGEGPRRVARGALWLAVPYGAWMFIGQNLLKARHALPLVLALALLLAVGVAALEAHRRVAGRALAVALAALVAAVTLPLARAQGALAAPAVQLVWHVREHLRASGTMLFTGEEARLFEHYAPYFRAGRPASGAQLEREAARMAAAGVAVYVTSAAPGAGALASHLEPVARFACDRLVRSHTHELVLYRYRPPGTPVARPLEAL